MTITERLQFIITASGADAAKEFRKLGADAEKELGRVDGLSKKGGVAMQFLKNHAVELGAVGAAAVVAFGAKAAGMAQDLALEAGKFADATGVTTEAASKWIEVSGDLGIEAGKVSGALLKMEKAAGTNPAVFEKFGVSIARTASGAVNANETFIRTIERLNEIKDPAERAAAGTALLGKSWSELGEIINSADVRGQLDSVSDAKIIDQSEVERARDFRDAWDELKGVVEDAALSIGEQLIPALTGITKTLTDLADTADDAGGFIGAIFRTGVDDIQWFRDKVMGQDTFAPLIEEAKDAERAIGANGDRWTALSEAMGNGMPSVHGAADGLDATAQAAEDAEEATRKLEAQWDALIGKLDDERSLMELQDSFAEVGDKAKEAMEKADRARQLTQDAMKSGSKEMAADAAKAWEDADKAARDLQYTVLDNKEAVINYGKEVLGLPPEVVTEVLAEINEGDYATALRRLELLEKTRTVTINVQEGRTSASSYMDPRYGATLPDMSGFQPMVDDGARGNRLVRPRSGSTSLFELAGLSGGGTVPIAQMPTAPALGPTASVVLAAVEKLASAQDAAKSSAEGFGSVAQKAWESVAFAGGDFATAQKDVTAAAIKSARSASDLAASQALLEGKTISAKDQAKIQQEELRRLAAQLGPDSTLASGIRNYIELLGKVTTAQDDSTESTKDAAKAAADRLSAALAQAGADLEAARATQAVTEAQNELVGALFRKTKTAEEAAAKAAAVAQAEQGLVDAVLREADALAEKQRNAAEASGVTLTPAQVAALKLQTIQAEASKLLPGNAKSALDAYAGTLQSSITLQLNVTASDPLSGRLIFETLDREMRLRGLGGLASV